MVVKWPAGSEGGASRRWPSAALVLHVDKRDAVRPLCGCIENAVALSVCPTFTAAPLCDWLDTVGLPTSQEASTPVIVNRMEAALRGHTASYRTPKRPAMRAMCHVYSSTAALIAVVANPMVQQAMRLPEVMKTAIEMYAEEHRQDLVPDGMPTVEQAGAMVPRAAEALSACERNPTELLATVLAAYSVVRALTTGNARVVIDVCLRDSSGAAEERVTYVAVHVTPERKLQELLQEMRSFLMMLPKRQPEPFCAAAGLVWSGDKLCKSGILLGNTRVVELPMPHFAEWDTTVTVAGGDELRLDVRGGFAPSVIARLLGHILEAVITRPLTEVRHATSAV